PPSAQTRCIRVQSALIFALMNTSLAPSRSWILAGWTTTAQIKPIVSTNKCRLIPLIFFPRVVPPCSAGTSRLDRLTIDAAGTGLRFLSYLLPNQAAERAVNLLPQSAPTPPMEVVADSALGREVMRQGGPCTPRRQEIEDRVEDVPKIGLARRPRWDRACAAWRPCRGSELNTRSIAVTSLIAGTLSR